MYLFGASGHGKVVAEIIEANEITIEAFIDFDDSKSLVWNYEVIQKVPEISIDGIISIGNNEIRKSIVEKYPQFRYTVLIHPNTFLSKRAEVGEGTVIMAGVSINSDVRIGKHCIVNTNASIDHECLISDFVHISPNVALAGNIEIGEGTHIGIGACIIQGVRIGKWCTIGAGSVIINNIPDGCTVVGNPGRIIKKIVK